MQPEELPIDILIFDTKRMEAALAKLPQGALGSLSFYDDAPEGPFISGWFVLNARSWEDVWDQVRQGGYSECTITLNVDPIGIRGMGWLWNVATNPQLVIDTVSVEFKRLAPGLGQPQERVMFDKTTVVERLGYVLGWSGNALGTVVLVATVFIFVWLQGTSDQTFFAGISAAVALLLFLAGYVLRYILAGK